jgi:hypothetical protein
MGTTIKRTPQNQEGEMIRNEIVREMVDGWWSDLRDRYATQAIGQESIHDLVSRIEEVLTADTEAREREAFEAAQEYIQCEATLTPVLKYPTYADYLKSKEVA